MFCPCGTRLSVIAVETGALCSLAQVRRPGRAARVLRGPGGTRPLWALPELPRRRSRGQGENGPEPRGVLHCPWELCQLELLSRELCGRCFNCGIFFLFL